MFQGLPWAVEKKIRVYAVKKRQEKPIEEKEKGLQEMSKYYRWNSYQSSSDHSCDAHGLGSKACMFIKFSVYCRLLRIELLIQFTSILSGT